METSSLGAIAHPLQPVVSQRPGLGTTTEKPERQTPSTRPESISADEMADLRKLKQRDREVKAHELAHMSAAGQYARGAAHYTYALGPDGQRYAIGGEVSIDIAKEADPQQTLQKALVIRQAALAPADPSSQDRQIAMQATQMAAEAQQEIAQLRAAARAETPSTDSARTSLPHETNAQDSDKGGTFTNLRAQRAITAFLTTSTLDQLPGANPIDAFI